MPQHNVRTDSRTPVAMALVLALLIFQLGCSSSGEREATTVAEPAPVGAATQVRTPAEIGTMDLIDDGDRASIELRADRPLVWTSFRNAEGDLVVELPNSMPIDSVTGVDSPSGLVRQVDVERLDDAQRPLTRLVVRTHEASEHSLTGDANVLRLELVPVERAQEVTLAYQPLEEETLDEPSSGSVVGDVPPAEPTSSGEPVLAPPPETAIPQTYGTDSAPQIGPAPVGVTASQLYDVQVVESSSRTVIQVRGDGEFAYSTFHLENPGRFVVDLEGVVNTMSGPSVPVGSTDVEQIRVGQFRPAPEPVTRVVFDLRDGGFPTIERNADGLVVAFGAAAGEPLVATVSADDIADPAMDEPTTEPEPEPVAVVAEIEDAGEVDPWAQPEEPTDETPSTETWPEDAAAATEEPAPTPTYEQPPIQVAEIAPEPADEPLPPPTPSMAVPVYEPAAPPSPEPFDTTDVSMVEAQNTDIDDDGRTERERLIESFGSLVVSRQQREYVGDPISMSLKNADLVETLRSFAKISDLNFVIQPGVRGTVTVELKSVPWDQAMEQILKINNLGLEIDGTIVRIAPTGKLRQEAEERRRLRRAQQQTVPLRTLMRSLSYARAGQVARLLRNRDGNILSRRGSVQVDQRTNTLIIRELPDNVDTVLAVIDNLDTPAPQVTIEARIVEATKNFSRSLGIEWGFGFDANPQSGNATGLQFPNTIDADGGVGLLTGGQNAFLDLAFGNILNTFRLNAQIQVAEAEGLVNIISAPRVTTLNNNAANIQSGLQIPVQTVSDRTVSVQYVNATLSLRVTPQVTAEGTVVLDINVAKRTPQIGLAVGGAGNVPINTRDARTKVIVRDGGTAVIGGIYEVTSNQVQDRVPGLSNIPILGHLFKNRNRNDANDELMIFITPRIIQL